MPGSDAFAVNVIGPVPLPPADMSRYIDLDLTSGMTSRLKACVCEILSGLINVEFDEDLSIPVEYTASTKNT